MILVFKNLCDTVLNVLSLIAIKALVMTLYLMLNEKRPHPPTARVALPLIRWFREFAIRD
jgi:gamma-glutamyl:cysteine ligase YbdK (ATP-grasp superfamily)